MIKRTIVEQDKGEVLKTTIRESVKKTQHPALGMLVALASVCGFLAVLVLITIAIHFIMM